MKQPHSKLPVRAPQAENLTTMAPAYRCKDGAVLRSALAALGVSLRYNLRQQKAEIRKGRGDWRVLTDRSSGALRDRIEQKFTYQTLQAIKPLRYGGEAWDTYCNSIFHEHEVDPFLVWLEALPDWDGVARCAAIRESMILWELSVVPALLATRDRATEVAELLAKAEG